MQIKRKNNRIMRIQERAEHFLRIYVLCGWVRPFSPARGSGVVNEFARDE